MDHEWCWVLVPLGHESLTPSTASSRVALSQGSKARCKTFMSERQQYPTHHSWANNRLSHPFTFPSTLKQPWWAHTMWRYYYQGSSQEDGVHNLRDFHVQNSWANMLKLGGGSNLRGRSESWGNILVILLYKEEEEEEEKTRKRKVVWEQSVTKLDLLSTPFSFRDTATTFAKVLDLLAQNNHRGGILCVRLLKM